MFFWNSLLSLWSNECWQFYLFPLPLQNPACTSGSSQFVYCWSLAWRILSIILLACEMSTNCAVVWAFFGIAFLWDWNENWLLSSFHMLARLCSKSFKLGFCNTWIEINKLGLEKTEIKLPTFTGSQRKQGNSRKASISASKTISFNAKVFDCMDDNKLENSLRDRNTTPPYLSPEKFVWGSRSNS